MKRIIKFVGWSLFILTILITLFSAFVVYGASQQWQSAIEISNWLSENWGVTVTAGTFTLAIGIIIYISKFLGSVGGLMTTATTSQEATTVSLALVTNELVEVKEELKKVKEQLNLQPSQIKEINKNVTALSNQNQLQTELMSVVMQKATNDPDVTKVINLFAEGTLLSKVSDIAEQKHKKCCNSK